MIDVYHKLHPSHTHHYALISRENPVQIRHNNNYYCSTHPIRWEYPGPHGGSGQYVDGPAGAATHHVRCRVTHCPAYLKSTQPIHYGDNQILIPEEWGMIIIIITFYVCEYVYESIYCII